MKDGMRFVDCDMHVMEPADLFDRYLDPKFADRVISDGPRGRAGAGRVVIDGLSRTGDDDSQQYRKRNSKVAANERQPLSASRSARYLEFAIERGYDAVAQVQGMEMEGVDIAVLFPTMGLSYPHFDSNFPNVANNLVRNVSRETAAATFNGGAALWGLRDEDFAKAEAAAAVVEA